MCNIDTFLVGRLWLLMTLTCSVEDIYDYIDQLSDEARKKLEISTNKAERQQLKLVLMRLSSLKQMDANGYFTISRETITSMISVRLNN